VYVLFRAAGLKHTVGRVIIIAIIAVIFRSDNKPPAAGLVFGVGFGKQVDVWCEMLHRSECDRTGVTIGRSEKLVYLDKLSGAVHSREQANRTVFFIGTHYAYTVFYLGFSRTSF